MRRIHRTFAVGASSVLLVLAVTPGALAGGFASARAGGRAYTLPNSNIKGSPVHFSPSRLHARARLTSTTCTTSQASFVMTNRKNKTEKVTLTASGATGKVTAVIPAHRADPICVRKGYTGTVHGRLIGGRRLTVRF